MRSTTTRLLAALAATAVLGTGLAACSDDSDSTGTAASESQDQNADLREDIFVSSKIGGAQRKDGPTTSPYSNNTDYILRYSTEYAQPKNLDKDQTTGPYMLVKVLDPATIVVRESRYRSPQERLDNSETVDENKFHEFVDGAPDITVHAIGIEPPDREDKKLYDRAMEDTNTALEERQLFIERDPALPETDDTGAIYAHVHNPTQITHPEDPMGGPGQYGAGSYAEGLLADGLAYFYMPPDQQAHRYAEIFYNREGQAADRGKGIWKGVPDDPK